MIKVICVGKLKEKYVSEFVNDYLNRINKYHKINLIELKDSGIDSEGISILKNISNKEFVVTLEIEGNKLNSVEFSKKIDNWLMNYSDITFVIGGSNGIDYNVKNRSNYSLSFSDMTFPHGVFRGMLLEQIYRSFKILNNETYHK